jgi:putative DNA primase/helicase
MPAETPACRLWLGFLDDATRGDAALIRFLRQWCGYALTGDIREHALLFIFGPGGNGKSVFLNTVSRIMGDYAITAAMDSFTASNSDRHPADLAMLRGARLVCVSETEEGRAWAENRIKQLTGGDPIAARSCIRTFHL